MGERNVGRAGYGRRPDGGFGNGDRGGKRAGYEGGKRAGYGGRTGLCPADRRNVK